MRHSLAGDAVVHLDDPGQQPADRVVVVCSAVATSTLSIDVSAPSVAPAASRCWVSTRPGAQRVELQERVAHDLRGAVVVGRDLDELLEPAVEVRDALPEARRALVREDAHRDRPAAVQLAEHPVGRHDDVVEEHLGELAHAVDHLERRDGDPGRVHVDEERGDAPVARVGRPGAREEHAAVGVLRQAGPDLLAVDDPGRRGARVAVGNGAAAQRREVAPGAGLGEPLAPHLRAGEQPGHDLGRELGRREVDEGRREHLDEREEPGVGEVAGRQRRAELGAEHRRAAEPADALGPAPAHPARVEQDRLHPLHLRDLLVERSRRRIRRRELVVVRVEPRRELGAEVGDLHRRGAQLPTPRRDARVAA